MGEGLRPAVETQLCVPNHAHGARVRIARTWLLLNDQAWSHCGCSLGGCARCWPCAEPRDEADRIAAHLLVTDPGEDGWAVNILRSAARAAVAHGAPDSAVAYLRRAVAEPPSGPLRPELLLELGFAQSYAGEPRFATDLAAALDAAADPTAQVSITLALGTHAPDRATQPRSNGGVRPRACSHRLRRTFERQCRVTVGAAQFDADIAGVAAHRVNDLRRLVEEQQDVPSSVFGTLAVAAVMANESAEAVRAVSRSVRSRERRSCCRRRWTEPHCSTTPENRSCRRHNADPDGFTGIHGITAQDGAMTTSMGPTVDLTREHLGSTDAAARSRSGRSADADAFPPARSRLRHGPGSWRP